MSRNRAWAAVGSLVMLKDRVLDIYPDTQWANGPPLTPAVLHILMVLAHGEAHGYEIMKQVEVDSDGRVKMGPGTLYGSLKRMIDTGLVGEARPPADADDRRRIYYAITPQGTAALDAELERYRAVVSLTAPRPALS